VIPDRPAVHDQVHRALASPVRRRILELLDGRTRDAHDLAAELELHVNTVRAHLSVLADGGLVSADPEERTQPGRPRLLYRSTAGDVVARVDDRGYRFLAEVLASHLAATSDEPSLAAEQAGTAWGRFLVDPPGPFVDDDTAIQVMIDLLADFGFAPDLDRTDRCATIRLRRCPFLDVARQHQDVVCAIHLGIMRGALDRLGSGVTARDLIPFVEPDLCVSHLEVAT